MKDIEVAKRICLITKLFHPNNPKKIQSALSHCDKLSFSEWDSCLTKYLTFFRENNKVYGKYYFRGRDKFGMKNRGWRIETPIQHAFYNDLTRLYVFGIYTYWKRWTMKYDSGAGSTGNPSELSSVTLNSKLTPIFYLVLLGGVIATIILLYEVERQSSH